MKKKSKFLAFCLSCVPGLGQLYLGLPQRAVLFFGIFLAAILGVNALLLVFHEDRIALMPMFAFPLIWFVSMADALTMADRVNRLRESPETGEDLNKLNDLKYIEKDNRKLITLALALIPGGGHMYMGLLKQGAFLMGCFFAALTITGWLNLPVVGFVLPVIWFYSIFEVYHVIDQNGLVLKTDRWDLSNWFLERPRWIGWGLITAGTLIILVKIAAPLVLAYLNPIIIGYLETGFVALILIAGGIKLVMGSTVTEADLGDEREQEEAIQ